MNEESLHKLWDIKEYISTFLGYKDLRMPMRGEAHSKKKKY
jgi:hypothetical protein